MSELSLSSSRRLALVFGKFGPLTCSEQWQTLNGTAPVVVHNREHVRKNQLFEK